MIVVGTVIGDYLGWRYAFLIAGIPGLFLALLACRLREVQRSTAAQKKEGSVISWLTLVRTRTLRYAFAGGTCITFCVGGVMYWTPAFVDRYHLSQAGRPTDAPFAASAMAHAAAGAGPALSPVAAIVEQIAIGAHLAGRSTAAGNARPE
jgi:MFS family permease